MPRGQYERKPRAESNDVAPQTSPAQQTCDLQAIRLDLLRVVHVHGKPAADIVARCKELEAYITGQPAA